MVFDTTASNTGKLTQCINRNYNFDVSVKLAIIAFVNASRTSLIHFIVFTGRLSAACVSLQNKLGRLLLWFARRKHIGEIILTHVWESLKIETSRAPDIKLFKRFREKGFDATPRNTAAMHTKQREELVEFLLTPTEKLKVFTEREKAVESYSRGDYKELLNLMEVYIGMNSGNYKFVKPGAVHRVRWMAKQLYCYKLVMLKDFLLTGIVSKYQMQKLQRFVDFCTFVLNPWWFNCPLAASAPRHDLALMDAIKKHDTVDGTVSAATLKTFGRHT